MRSSSSELSSPALVSRWYAPPVEVNVGLLAHNVGVAATHTLDLGEGVLDLALAVDVSVEKTG